MKIVALEWLYRQLKKKEIALVNAQQRKNCTPDEIRNLKKSIEIMHYLIEAVKGGDT